MGRRAAREPARGPLRAQPRQGRQGQLQGAVRLLPRLHQRPERGEALPVHLRLVGRLRARVGDAHRDPGPAPRGQAGQAARRQGRGRRPLARRDDHHRLRHLGLQGQAGRARPVRARVHRRRQQARVAHRRGGHAGARRPPGGRPLAHVRRHRRALRGPLQRHRLARRAQVAERGEPRMGLAASAGQPQAAGAAHEPRPVRLRARHGDLTRRACGGPGPHRPARREREPARLGAGGRDHAHPALRHDVLRQRPEGPRRHGVVPPAAPDARFERGGRGERQPRPGRVRGPRHPRGRPVQAPPDLRLRRGARRAAGP